MKNAFTVIELLVVVFIIAALTGLAFPVYSRVAENGRAVACLSNLRQLGVALNLYLGEHDSTFPSLAAARSSTSQDVAAIDNTLNAYAENSKTFICPSDAKGVGAETGTSYYWNSALNNQVLSDLNFLKNADPGQIPILGDKEGFHPFLASKVNILYADGHVTKDLKFFTSP